MADRVVATFTGRLTGNLTDEEAAWVERTSAKLDELRSGLLDRQRRIDELLATVAAAEGRAPVSPPGAGSAVEPLGEPYLWAALVARSRRLNETVLAGPPAPPGRSLDPTLTGAVAGEQALETITAPDVPPDWYSEVAGRLGIDADTVVGLGSDPAAMEGLTFLVRGFRGEQLVDGWLADGVLAGPPGTSASLADTTNQPCWDVAFVDGSGEAVALANVKITSSADVVRGHLDAHPDVGIVYTTSDAAGPLAADPTVTVIGPGDAWPVDAAGPVVVDLGVASGELHGEVASALDAVGADGGSSLAGEILDAVPFLALGIVGLRAARRAVTTDDDAADIRAAAWGQTKDVAATVGVSELAGFAVAEWVRAPVAIGFALARSVRRTARASVDLSVRRAHRTRDTLARLRGAKEPVGSPG